MKKKHRRAVCKSLICVIKPFKWLSIPFALLWVLCMDWECDLKTKLRIYDYDPE